MKCGLQRHWAGGAGFDSEKAEWKPITLGLKYQTGQLGHCPVGDWEEWRLWSKEKIPSSDSIYLTNSLNALCQVMF